MIAKSIFRQHITICVATIVACLGTSAQAAVTPPPALEMNRLPDMSDTNRFIKDQNWAVVLGKALFWDMAVGGDGVQACASCHFEAGADSRSINQINPGTNGLDTMFGSMPTGGGGPNYQLDPADFPLPKAANDVISSQGVFLTEFVGYGGPGNPEDLCEQTPDSVFHVNNINTRRVEPRNTPTVINAVFNHRNFWDGRANNLFNGVDPHGKRTNLLNPDQGIYRYDRRLRKLVKEQVLIKNSSLASQAAGPPGSVFEMSCGNNRSFNDIGRKMLHQRALANQVVSRSDSVLGNYVHTSGKGLKYNYQRLVKNAFKPEYWQSRGFVDGGYAQMEANFSLFFALAIQAYEATLVSNQSKYDKAQRGQGTLTAEETLGLDVFLNKGKCINCHTGPEFTGASVALRANQPDGNAEAIECMIMGNGESKLYDGGFYNIGVRATAEDIGLGGTGPDGNPLSFSRQIVSGVVVDGEFNQTPHLEPGANCINQQVAVDGAFKVPTIRNVELTAPFFHNGGRKSLEEVVEFYDEGGRGIHGFAQENSADLDPDIVPLGLTDEEQAALVAFMKTLTDERVRLHSAPFDHPELIIPNGHPAPVVSESDPDHNMEATQDMLIIPAVGFTGYASPLPKFLE